jgi:S1-C subfamily serine protease
VTRAASRGSYIGAPEAWAKRIKMLSGLFLVLLAAGARPCQAAPGRQSDAVRAAVVKVYTTYQVPQYLDPWAPGWVYSGTGSGCIIEGRRILTNAHMVGNATLIQVRRYGQAERHTARVQFVSHEADLAVLSVDAPAFFDGVTPLKLGPLPPLQQEVSALGFPQGGDSLSITRGVLSRIEHIEYVHSTQSLLGGQIDAALNPGNSGGPVVVDGQIVGIAMQVVFLSQNIAYMVPAPVIAHFLADVADGRYDGFPNVGLRYEKMENEDMRRRYGVPSGKTGVLVLGANPGSGAAQLLHPGDVLLSISGHAVANDGTVEFRPQERTSFSYFAETAQLGQSIPIEILRGGKVSAIVLPLNRPLGASRLVAPPQYDVRPDYFLYGGLLFEPLTYDYLRARNFSSHDLMALTAKAPRFEGEEVLVLVRTLASEANEGYHDLTDGVVTAVDGTKPRDLPDFVRLVETGQSPFVTITFDEGQQIVLERERARVAGPDIMKLYGIQRDRQLPEATANP